MARLMTFLEAQTRFAGLATNNHTIEATIQEAVDRIFEMGRYPGTTEEFQIEDDEWILDAETNEYFIRFDEQMFSGALGFRTGQRGWSIADKSILYKDKINGGDLQFVDYGTIEDEGARLRKYRAPIGFTLDGGPYFVLLKKEPPMLADDDLVPIEGLGGLKCAIQAVIYELNGDVDRGNQKWGEMEAFMRLSERQTEGVKKYYMGLDSSLRRQPKQFF